MSRTCLIVDDNLETVDILEYFLKKAGFNVVSARPKTGNCRWHSSTGWLICSWRYTG